MGCLNPKFNYERFDQSIAGSCCSLLIIRAAPDAEEHGTRDRRSIPILYR